jgi:tetratricopeptide (TPR) repeat protein
VAQQQETRSFGLRAALTLAKLYLSTGRPSDAHAVLAPALEGFSPTPEMPEIAAAQALLTTLAEMDEVKAAVAQRKRRLHLQTAYGHAMMWSTGFASEETKAAFARATELATGSDNSLDRLVAAHGQWVLATVRGELRATRGLALTFLREAEGAGRIMEACVVHRSLALISYFSGDFAEAGSHCEQALAACEPEWDLEVLERFGDGISAVAMSFLALTAWQLGDVERARELIESANRRAAEFGHGPSMTTPLYWKSYFEILRGDASAALTAAEALEAISRDQGMSFWGVMSKLNAGWARGRFNNPIAGAAELQQGLTAYASHGARLAAGFYTGLLAELEAETLGAESALSRIDEALALVHQVNYRCDLPFLHRLRGDILLKRDPNNPAPAEEAFQTAIVVARQQGARSQGLD